MKETWEERAYCRGRIWILDNPPVGIERETISAKVVDGRVIRIMFLERPVWNIF